MRILIHFNQVIQFVTSLFPLSLEVTIHFWKGHVFTMPKKRHQDIEGFTILDGYPAEN